MDGLEAVEVRLSEVRQETKTFRIDSSYFNKYSIALDKRIKSIPHTFIENKKVVSGPFGSTMPSDCYLESGGIPFVRIENIKQGFFIEHDTIVHISLEDNLRIKNSQLYYGDLILSKVGNTIGYFGIVDEETNTCNISENNIGIKLSQFSIEFRYYLCAFLNCKYANNLVLRRVSGNAQPKLNVDDMTYIPIPIYSDIFYKKIFEFIDKAFQNLTLSKTIYGIAQDLLLLELGLAGYVPTKEAISIKTFANSFGSSGRLDAEYYQPKYDEIMGKIKKTNNDILSNLTWCKKSIEPGSMEYINEGIPFIRVADLTKYGISQTDVFLNRIPFANMDLQPKKNTILLSKDGSVGIAYKVEEDLDVVTSGAILHLTVKNQFEILPDYLTLVLNSTVVQMQAERDAGGSVIQHWKPSEIEKVVIPILDIEIQQQIADKIQQSFDLRKQFVELLEHAKQAVEMAIEQGENAAIAWLEEVVK